MRKSNLSQPLWVLLIIVLSFLVLYYAKPFLAPVMFAVVISMLLLPVSLWLERKRLPNWLSATLAVLLFALVIGGVVYVIVWQVSGLVQDSGNIEQKTMQKIAQFQKYVQQRVGLTEKEQGRTAIQT